MHQHNQSDGREVPPHEPRRARGDGAARVSRRLACGAVGSTTRPNREALGEIAKHELHEVQRVVSKTLQLDPKYTFSPRKWYDSERKRYDSERKWYKNTSEAV